jgi:hypothetical protein
MSRPQADEVGGAGAAGEAITPDEIREALRRYLACTSPLGAFCKMRSPVACRLLIA